MTNSKWSQLYSRIEHKKKMYNQQQKQVVLADQEIDKGDHDERTTLNTYYYCLFIAIKRAQKIKMKIHEK